MLKVILIFAIVHATLAQTPVKPCAGSKLLPKAVYFGGRQNFCKKLPCILKRGKTAVTEVEFTSPINSRTIMPKATAKVFGMSFDMNLGVTAASACKLLEKGCPLIKGDTTSIRIEKIVDKTAMAGTADVEYTLVGENNQSVFCYKLKTTVV